MTKNIPLYAVALAFCLIGGWAAFRLISDGIFALGIFVTIAVVFIIIVTINESLAPWRWLSAGLVMALLFTIFPILYTFYLSFTNMSGGNLATKTQAVNRISAELYTPDDEAPYSWTAYRKGNNFLLLLYREPRTEDSEGAPPGNNYFTVKPGSPIEPFKISGYSNPLMIEDYTEMRGPAVMQNLKTLGDLEFGEAPRFIRILSLQEAAVRIQLYSYNAQADTFTDNRSGEVFRSVRGTFTSASGKKLIPGFIVNIGIDNYKRFLGNAGFLRPVFGIFLWNALFAVLSVSIAFAIGMMIALLFDDLKFRKIIRTLLIIPYPIPVLVSIMVWRALLNDNMGLITTIITNIFGASPKFFTNVGWTRFALIILNVYLSYPYFYVLSSGALKSIPGELFEAAAIDGASSFTVTRKIIMPMVMRILAPLVLASICFNFNNFTLIWGFNQGLPAMADTAVPMGYTDLLISFIFRLGFSSSSAADYGFVASITVMLFLVVALMVFFQIRNMRTIKDIKE